MNIPINESWVGEYSQVGHFYNNWVESGTWPFVSHYTTIDFTQNSSTKTSTVTLTNNIGYIGNGTDEDSRDIFTNQSYTLKLGNITRTNTLPTAYYYWTLTNTTKFPFPDLTYTVTHNGDITVPYSLSYTARAEIEQISGATFIGRKPFQVTVTYSGSITVPGFSTLYGSVNGVARPITKLYGSVNGSSVKINKLYGSVNGVAKRIF